MAWTDDQIERYLEGQERHNRMVEESLQKNADEIRATNAEVAELKTELAATKAEAKASAKAAKAAAKATKKASKAAAKVSKSKSAGLAGMMETAWVYNMASSMCAPRWR